MADLPEGACGSIGCPTPSQAKYRLGLTRTTRNGRVPPTGFGADINPRYDSMRRFKSGPSYTALSSGPQEHELTVFNMASEKIDDIQALPVTLGSADPERINEKNDLSVEHAERMGGITYTEQAAETGLKFTVVQQNAIEAEQFELGLTNVQAFKLYRKVSHRFRLLSTSLLKLDH